jgi:large subunit ribosomal protein L29
VAEKSGVGTDEPEAEQELLEHVFRLRVQKATGQLDRPKKIREARKDLARVKTALSQRRRAEGQSG